MGTRLILQERIILTYIRYALTVDLVNFTVHYGMDNNIITIYMIFSIRRKFDKTNTKESHLVSLEGK